MNSSDILRARVCVSRGDRAQVDLDSREYEGIVRGTLLASGELPVTGDWVHGRAIGSDQILIEEIEPRKTQIARRSAGRAGYEQVLAANVDTALIVCGLDSDFNLRRIERYLAIAHEGGVKPIVILNKADLASEIPTIPRVPIIAISALTGDGFEQIENLLSPGSTIVLLGSSGAGKSTILNRLLGNDRQRTNSVREHDSRGRHTTTERELVKLPSGAFVIDTPGLREIQLLVSDDALDAVFDEIAELAHHCRFRDCTHHDEPGCAVRGAVDPDRLNSLHKLQKEAHRLSGEWREKEQWRVVTKSLRQLYKHRDKPRH